MFNIHQSLSRWCATVAVAVLLAACGSTVKLDEAQVTDAKPVPVQATQGSQTPVATGGIKQVDMTDTKPVQAAPNLPLAIYFDFDSYVIKPEFQAAVESHAKHLVRTKGKVTIEGHTDERGGREYNLALGQKRSEAVRRALGLLGVQEAQVEAVSFGKEKLVDASGTEEGMAKNRRAMFSYR